MIIYKGRPPTDVGLHEIPLNDLLACDHSPNKPLMYVGLNSSQFTKAYI